MISERSGDYVLHRSDGALPETYSELKAQAALVDEFELSASEGGISYVGVSIGEDPVTLIVAQRYQPSGFGFEAGALVIPETGLLFAGAGERLLAYDLETPCRLWEDSVDHGFYAWKRHGDIVLMVGELELAAWSADGRKLWSTVVEPPWDYSVADDRIVVDVMGVKSSFSLQEGPLDTNGVPVGAPPARPPEPLESASAGADSEPSVSPRVHGQQKGSHQLPDHTPKAQTHPERRPTPSQSKAGSARPAVSPLQEAERSGQLVAYLASAMAGGLFAGVLVEVLVPTLDWRIAVFLGIVSALAGSFTAGNIGEAVVLVIILSVVAALVLVQTSRLPVGLQPLQGWVLALCCGASVGQLMMGFRNEFRAGRSD